MPARSVAELLRRPFDQLTLDDIRQLIVDVGDEGETLYFERKRSISGQSLAKACAAFANTFGGLLVVGADDESGAVLCAVVASAVAEAIRWRRS